MNQERINLLPDPQFAALKPRLASRIERAAKAITPENFANFCDAAMRKVITNALTLCGASEGSIWLHDENVDHLVNVFNNGPDVAKLVGFRQPIKAGIISMVFATHQPFMENEVFKNSMQAKEVDKLVGKRTNAMIAAPLFFAHNCRGVISAVQLVPATEAAVGSPGFTAEHFTQMQFASELLTRLIDFKFLSLTTGWGKD